MVGSNLQSKHNVTVGKHLLLEDATLVILKINSHYKEYTILLQGIDLSIVTCSSHLRNSFLSQARYQGEPEYRQST